MPPPPERAHIGLAYCIHDLPADIGHDVPAPLLDPPAVSEPDRMLLAALHQHADAGCYTWDVLAEIPMLEPF